MKRDLACAPVHARVGDVFQINERHGRAGWIGAFLLATEIKSWGVMGFVSTIETHDQQRRAYIRLKWDELDYIGHTNLRPADEVEGNTLE
jgi:hypothetical protein